MQSISDRAMLHGARLRLTDASELAGRLYAFNRRPTDLAQMRAGQDRGGFQRMLGLTGTDDFEGFRELRPSPARRDWMEWRRAGREATATSPCKLYVCVQPEAVATIFKPCAATAAQQEARGFKIGAGSGALNRPDKFILYFDTVAALRACAHELAVILADLEPHELPFAATLSVPTLAWGIDPPDERGRTGASWRSWVCDRLADALLVAANDGADPTEAVAFARSSIARGGLDPRSWAPDRVRFG